MKKLFYSLLLLSLSFITKAQTVVGNEQYITVNLSSGQTTTALLHLPSDYSTATSKRYPLFLFNTGLGHGAAGGATITDLGPAYFFANGWNGKIFNPRTGDTTEYIWVTPHPLDNNFRMSASQMDYLLGSLISTYRVDTTDVVLSGLSAGGQPTIWYPSHISGANPPVSWTYFTPSHKIAVIIPMSAENNSSDPVNYYTADSVYAWAFGSDTTVGTGDSHGVATHDFIKHINLVNPALGRFTNYVGGHCCWNQFYDPAYKENGYNIYQYGLLHPRSSAPSVVNTLTSSMSTLSYCVTGSSGATASINYVFTGTLNTGNTFTVQMSNSSGSFTSPVVLYSVGSVVKSGTLTFTVPANTATGTGYRFRVVASNVSTVGSDNGSNVAVNLAAVSVSPTGDQSLFANTNGTAITSTKQSSGTDAWYYGNAMGNYATNTGITSSTYTPRFSANGTYYVVDKVNFPCGVVTSAPVKVVVTSTTAPRVKRYVTKLGDNTVHLDGRTYTYNHGDTIVLTAAQNPYSAVTIDYFDSITVMNEGGQVQLNSFANGAIPGGFSFTNTKHVHLTGTGSGTPNGSKGFLITTPDNRGVGVSIQERSSDFEIDNLEVFRKSAGMWIKQEVSCADSLSFPNWILRNFNIHDNKFHNLSTEGLYLGSTAMNGTAGTQHPPTICNGDTSSNKPLRLGGFHIWNNSFDSTGRAAIQLSGADADTSEINNNTIIRCGSDPDIYQGNGISIGTYTRAYIHDNSIDYTKKDGMQLFGSYEKVSNNTVNHSGNSGMGQTSTAASLFIDTRNSTNPSAGHTNPDSSTFIIQNNTLGLNSDYNIRMYATLPTFKHSGNCIVQPGATSSIAVGIIYGTSCTGATHDSTYQVPYDSSYHQTFYKYINVSRTYPQLTRIQNYYLGGTLISGPIVNTVYNRTFLVRDSTAYDSVIHVTRYRDTVVHILSFLESSPNQLLGDSFAILTKEHLINIVDFDDKIKRS